MGQQQIFLLVIVSIIAGIATIVAINTMDATRKDAKESAIRQDIFMVLNDAQVYYQKSGLYEGNQSFDNFSMSNVHSVDSLNENGSYSVSGSGKTVTVEGTGISNDITLTATGTISSTGMEVTWSE